MYDLCAKTVAHIPGLRCPGFDKTVAFLSAQGSKTLFKGRRRGAAEPAHIKVASHDSRGSRSPRLVPARRRRHLLFRCRMRPWRIRLLVTHRTQRRRVSLLQRAGTVLPGLVGAGHPQQCAHRRAELVSVQGAQPRSGARRESFGSGEGLAQQGDLKPLRLPRYSASIRGA